MSRVKVVARYAAFVKRENAVSFMRFNNKRRKNSENQYFLLKTEVARSYSDVVYNGYVLAQVIKY